LKHIAAFYSARPVIGVSAEIVIYGSSIQR
jgi:hypothetical protein